MTINITLGLLSGYNNLEESFDDKYNEFISKLMDYEESSSYPISWVIKKAKTLYLKKWGCLDKGESVVILESDYTEYNSDISLDRWKREVIKRVMYLKEEFNQSTVRYKFINTDVYIEK